MTIRARVFTICRQGELDCDFVLSGQIRVADFGVWDLESGLIADVECELISSQLVLAPIPAT